MNWILGLKGYIQKKEKISVLTCILSTSILTMLLSHVKRFQICNETHKFCNYLFKFRKFELNPAKLEVAGRYIFS